MFALINNLVIRILGAQKSNNLYRQLSYAHGVYADLYFMVDDVQYRISGNDLDVLLYKQENTTFMPFYVNNRQESNKILESLFYTIITNYSLYAYNITEYASPINDNVSQKLNSGKWLEGLFHKNDGYYTPIVITPYRNNGTINVEKEAYLAEQRINALALLAKAKGNSFIDDYQPEKLIIELNRQFEAEKTDILYQILKNKNCRIDGDILLSIFKNAWQHYITEKYGTRAGCGKSECFNLGIFYLAYKSIKICLIYPDYRRVLGIDNVLIAYNHEPQDLEYYELLCIDKANDAIRKILTDRGVVDEEHNHLVLKIEQTLDYLKYYIDHGRYKWKDKEEKSVNRLLSNKKI